MTSTTAQSLAEMAPVRPGEIVTRLLCRAPGGSVAVFAFAQGEELAEHATPRQALVVVTDGTLDVTVEGQTHAVRAGGVLPLPAGAPHSVRAQTDARMLLVLLRADG